MKELDTQAVKWREQCEENRYKRQQVYDGGKVDGSNVTYREVLTKDIEEIKKIKNQRKTQIDRVKELNNRQRELDGEKSAILRSCPRNYQNEKDLQAAIKEKQTKYETSSMSNKDEKNLLKDIDTLKRALPEIMKLSVIEPELQKIREEKKVLSSQLDNVKRIIDDKEDKIQDTKNQSQAQRDKQSETRDRAEKFTVVIDKLNEDIRNVYQTKDQMRESYFKQLYEFELQNDKVRWIKGMINQQKRIVQAKDEKEDRIQKKRQELDATPNPNLKEIETCAHLLQYCNKLKIQQGLVPASSEEVAAKIEKESINEYNRQDIEQKLKDGKIQAVSKKDDSVMSVGAKGGKKGKKQNKPKQSEGPKSFNIDFAVINKFGLVQVSPPLAPEDLDHKIEELTEKQKIFQKNGDEILKEERENLEKHIEKMVEEDIEREAKAAEQEEEYDEEEEEKETKDE